MAALSDTELRAMLAAEKADALAAVTSSKLSKERSDAMDYYNGDVSKDMPSGAGRSSAVSTDVSDTIEGLMPDLMEIFCGGDEYAKFTPVGAEDVPAAEQETDYVNYVFMQKNPGFLILYSFIKDALLSKNGVVKVWTESKEDEEKETYYDQSPEALAAILQKPGVEVIEHNENDDQTHDIKIVCRKKYKHHVVEPVPPEEFGIARRAKNIADATYCFHETTTTVGDLIQQGYDAAQVKAIPTESGIQSTEQESRDTVDESSGASGDDGLNVTTRPVKVTEHYVRMDYEGNGKPALYRVKTAGEQGEVLRRDGKDDVEEVSHPPFAAMTPIIVTHRFIGKSVADLVMDIQRIKTALLRGTLDAQYIANNPRVVVAQSHVTDQTLDDLLVSRPNQIVRVKSPGGIEYQKSPEIGGGNLELINYMDATREWRTGVTRQGQGVDATALQNQSATAAVQGHDAAQSRMRLIARIFAETGIRDLFLLLHAEIRKHGDKAETVLLRNKWVPVDPRQWKTRKDMVINVGLGTGSKQAQLGNIMALISLQKEAVAAGMTNIVTPTNLYNSAKEVTKIIGKKDVESFFSDPDEKDPQTGQLKNPPQPPPPDPAMIKVQADTQMKQQELQIRGQEIQAKAQIDAQADQRKAQIEQVQAQADMVTQDRKMQGEMQLAQQKFELEKQLKMMDFELKREQHAADMEMKREAHQQALATGQLGMVASAEAHEHKMAEAKNKPKPGAKA